MLINYSGTVLRSIWLNSKHVYHLTNINLQTRSNIISLGIRKDESLRCYMRSRAGKNMFNRIKVLPTEHRCSKIFRPCNMKVVKNLERCTPKPKPLSMCLINPRSCNNKAAVMKQFINVLDLDVCAVTETWLKEGDEVARVALRPEGYEILSTPWPNRLGGIAIIHKEDLKITKLHEYKFGTCECTDFKISFGQSSYTLGVFYRPDDHPFLAFLNDLVDYMENSITNRAEFLLLGDFNIHVNKLHVEKAEMFHDFLSSFGLQNHILFPTHKSQNTLDLVITHENVNIVSNLVQGEMISDHFAVLFDLHIPTRPKQEKIIRFRQVKDINISKFARDLQAALVPFSSTNQCELSVLVDGYNQALASTLDQHAPLKTKKIVYEHYQPWYCTMLGDAIRNHRKLERTWRADVNCKEKWAAFDKQRKLTQEIIKKKEKEYYHQLFREKATNPKEVFSIANALLARNSISLLSECSSLMELANDFNIFFAEKNSYHQR